MDDCFAFEIKATETGELVKGCGCLNIRPTPIACSGCKFKRTVAEYEEKENNKKFLTGKGKFKLFFDGKEAGIFPNIKAIDEEWLKKYFLAHEAEEKANKPSYTMQDDYNILFVTHEIKIEFVEGK